MIICGIDPGANGALALLDSNDILYIMDYKTSGLASYIELFQSHKPHLVIVEKVNAMPGQGVKSMFSFGQRLGEIEGMLQAMQIPYQLVQPKVWQKLISIPPKAEKKQVASTIQKLYPTAQLYGVKGGLLDGRSDALGLLHYGRSIYGEKL